MKKGKQPELITVKEDTDESVLRLNVGREEQEPEVEIVEKLTEGIEDDIDELFKEEEPEDTGIDDKELDKLFTEKKPSRHDDGDLRRALIQAKTSKASLLRLKSGEATKVTLAEQLANNKTLEDEWDEKSEEKKGLHIAAKVIFINVAVILLCLGGFAVWKITQSDEDTLSDELAERKEQREQAEQIEAKTLDQVHIAETVIGNYFKAGSLDARLPLIYRGQELKEQIAAHETKKPAIMIDNMKYFDVGPAGGHSDDIWVGRFSYSRFNQNDFVYLRRDGDGGFMIDWTSRAGVAIDDIEKFSNIQDTEPKVFRFLIKEKFENGFYNWGFTDKEYGVVELNVPGVDKTFHGYISLKNKALLFKMKHYFEELDELKTLNVKGGDQVILKVRFLENTAPENTKCFVIEDLVSKTWLFEDEAEYLAEKATKKAELKE